MLAAAPPNVDGASAAAQRTLRDASRATEVIKRLRSMFTRSEPVIEPLNLSEAVREVLALSSSDLQRNGVIVQTALANKLPPVMGDRIQLQQVMLNLILNASDALRGISDRPRRLIISSGFDQDQSVHLTVEDNGIGISREVATRLFEPFFTTKVAGMGIGLSISRSIIESHGGRLWAIPKDNGPGAVFCFSVPTWTDHTRLGEMPVREA
ncbi:MAG TPA: ATP-binding protein [Alphaproteobacteria bacterium]|nr:ATP-binding protein [Alphaproteobacteria bacterium]